MTGPISETEKSSIIEAYGHALQPLSRDDLSEVLERAFLRAVIKKEEAANLPQRVALLLSDLKDYPADIVLHELETWKKHSRWIPNIHDLEQRMDWRVRQRTVVFNALKGAKTS